MYKYVLTTAAALIFAGSAHAALIGSMELVDTDVPAGINFVPGQVDIYHFVVTGTEGEIVDTFDFTSATGGGFTGEFVQSPLGAFKTDTSLPNLGTVQGDTFFVSPVASPTAVQITDTPTALEAAFSFTATPIDTSGGVVAAVFSVLAGGPAPSFNGGFAVVDGLDVPIVPEPASLAMIGLGGLAMLRRRVA